jgi:hypothetical protein
MKGYDVKETKTERLPPKLRTTDLQQKTPKRRNKRKLSSNVLESPVPNKKQSTESENVEDVCENVYMNVKSATPAVEETTNEVSPSAKRYPAAEKREYFIEQATCPKNCYRYTGLTRPKLDLIFSLVEQKSNSMSYWRGCIDTIKPSGSLEKKEKKKRKRVLTKWEEFVLTLVRLRKGFDIHFLADTFSISAGQVSRVFNTWIIFLSEELTFLVPWPSQSEIKKFIYLQIYFGNTFIITI